MLIVILMVMKKRALSVNNKLVYVCIYLYGSIYIYIYIYVDLFN